VEIIDRIDRNRLASILVALTAFAAGAFFVQYLRSCPQIGSDEEVSKTIDALFTALTSKDVQRLSDCEQRLQSYREAGDLPHSAAANLEGMIKQARAGEWESSARILYDFILAQRRMN
jgi:hypothetical protein